MKSTLLPRFSLRLALIVLTGAAFFFVLVGKGLGGWAWAIGVTVGAASILAALATHFLFAAAFTGLGRVLGADEIVARTSQGGLVRQSGEATQPDVQPGGEAAP
ncbi:MAG: hypothetical protein CMJ58_09625 [Planctomycetaceae bacterium]|nr:hypothetical protein [Planctomycetaceae bacterium]